MTTAHTAAAPRVRHRQLDTSGAPPAPLATTEMVALATQAYEGNVKKNAGTREEKGAKRLLEAAMAKVAGLCHFEFRHSSGKVVDVDYGPTSGQVVDAARLAALVGNDQVVAIATVTQDAVRERWGTNTLNQCLVSVKSEPALRIKERKGGK